MDVQESPESRAVIDMWRTASSWDFGYFEKVEGLVDGFWNGDSVFRRRFNELDTRNLLEIACGAGRHVAQVVAHGIPFEQYIAVDTSIDAIGLARDRFSADSRVRCLHLTESSNLSMLEDNSVTGAFSYDAMVHFEIDTVWNYLRELRRVLVVGAKALLHHSNFTGNPEGVFTSSPGWRNYMSEDLMKHVASRSGLHVLSMDLMDWAAPSSDALTVMIRR